jgi:hypothetical protein
MDEPCTLLLTVSKKATLDAVYSNNAERVFAALTQEKEVIAAYYSQAMEPEQKAHRAKVDEILKDASKNVFMLKTAEREFHEKELKVRVKYIRLLQSYTDQTISYYLEQSAHSRDREQPLCKKLVSGALCLANFFLEGCSVITHESSENTWQREHAKVTAVLHEFRARYTHEIFLLVKPRIIPEDEN